MAEPPQGDEQLTIRTLTDDDLSAFSSVLASAFLTDSSEEFQAEERLAFEPARSHAVFDGETMSGTGELLSRRLALPGAEPVRVGAVTSIGVAPGHRRRGVLSRIMRAQLEMLHETGESLAILWASEGAIYGRYGYGLGTQFAKLVLPRGTAFRRDVTVDPTPVRELPRERALPLVRDIYDKVWQTRAGHLDRTDNSWEYFLFDGSERRDGQSGYRFALHPQAYAIYRVKANWQDRGPRSTVNVHTLTATTPESYAAILRYLLDIDLVGEVVLRLGTDEPLVHMLADPRAAVRTMFDALWVRLVDVDQALTARRFLVPLDVVLAVDDELCPWNAGRWRLLVGPDGRAEVTRTDDEADLALDVSTLAAAYLGGTRLSTLAAAGRVRECHPGTLARASLAFLHDEEPRCLEVF